MPSWGKKKKKKKSREKEGVKHGERTEDTGQRHQGQMPQKHLFLYAD
jgi:hypothetical protein